MIFLISASWVARITGVSPSAWLLHSSLRSSNISLYGYITLGSFFHLSMYICLFGNYKYAPMNICVWVIVLI
jgi:hypothetical protein